jgi:hypothetical protein
MTGGGGDTTTSAGGSVGGGPGAGGSGGGCSWDADTNPCGDGFYCNAPDCQTGTCEPLAMNDDGAREPVCGCDGVNYWNENTAAAYGMSVAATGECAQPLGCNPMDAPPCPLERHFCAQLVANVNACFIDPSIVNGVCWGMPAECPPIVSAGWRPCNNTLPQEPCAGECEAIKDKRKHFQDSTCQ